MAECEKARGMQGQAQPESGGCLRTTGGRGACGAAELSEG